MAFNPNDSYSTGTDSTYSQMMPFLMQALGTGAKAANPYLALGTLGLGAIQTIGSLIGLNKLKREARPQYTISPELQKAYGMAEQRATQGFMPTEIAQFQQGLAGTLEAQRRNAIAMGGGGLSQAITGGLGGQALRSLNTLAAQDAERRLANERYFGGMAGQMQAQRNRITQQDIAYRMAKEQAMGQALRSGTTNLASGINAWGMGGFKNPFKKLTDTSTNSDVYQKIKFTPGGFNQPIEDLPTEDPYLGNNPFKGSLYKSPSMLSTEY